MTGVPPSGSGLRPDGLSQSPLSQAEPLVPNALLELAERCEQATGPDGDLERAIKAALLGREYISFEDDLAKRQAATPPQYTASLDAAMTLVPEGLSFTLYAHADEAHCEVFRFHPSKGLLGDVESVATPALALCAAALRARAAQ